MTKHKEEKNAKSGMETNVRGDRTPGKDLVKQGRSKRGSRLYAPPGMSLWRERAVFWSLLAVAVWYSLRFFSTFQWHLQNVQDRLETYDAWGVDMRVNMTDLSDLLEGKFALFGVVILFCLIAIGARYRYYHQGSKSIYLMRRLPDRSEWHRSCLVQPLLRIALVLVVMTVLLLIFYTVYMNQVPEECLQPNQWQKLWRWIL